MNINRYLYISIYALTALAFLRPPAFSAPDDRKPETNLVGNIYKENVDAVVSVISYDEAHQPVSQGSGFFITSNGRVVTNQHVIASARNISVKLQSGAFYSMRGVLAVDCAADLAILDLAVTGVKFDYVALGDVSAVEVGDPVVTIGNPLSLEASVSDGIVSGIRHTSDGNISYIQTTAPVSRGNSGGPLFNSLGEAIGIITFKFAEGENLNFAVSVQSLLGMLPYAPSNPFATEIDRQSAGDGETYLSPDKYACNASGVVPEERKQDIGAIAGTYTGVWQSNAGVGGVALLTVVVEGDSIVGKLRILGSPLGYQGDDLIGSAAEFSDGIWTVKFQGKNSRMSATAIFKDGSLLGDYKFGYRLIGRDRGQWILKK